MRRSISLMLILVCCCGISTINSKGIAERPIVDRQGHVLGKREGKTQTPKEVVDTLRLSGGVGIFPLNQYFRQQQRRTAPTNKYQIWPTVTQIVDDTSVTVCNYAIFLNTTGDTLTIKSSSANDSSLVIVRALIR